MDMASKVWSCNLWSVPYYRVNSGGKRVYCHVVRIVIIASAAAVSRPTLPLCTNNSAV